MCFEGLEIPSHNLFGSYSIIYVHVCTVHYSYLNATLQPIYLRTDVGLVLALMDMFSCLQQEMTEVSISNQFICISI